MADKAISFEEVDNMPKMTIRQYEALSEDIRTEVIKGVPYAMASPSQTHRRIALQLGMKIENYLNTKGGTGRAFMARL